MIVKFEAIELANGTWTYDIEELLKKKNISLAVNRLDTVELQVELNGIHIRSRDSLNPFNDPTCMKINATVSYKSSMHWYTTGAVFVINMANIILVSGKMKYNHHFTDFPNATTSARG